MLEAIWNAIVSEFDRWKFYLIALAWLMLMIFFTYTAILAGSMTADSCLWNVHWVNQCTIVSLLVNIGLLFMVVFDYMLAGKNVPHTIVWVIFIGIALAIGIYGHAGILSGNALSNYKWPLNVSTLAQWLHFWFLIVLLWLKERAVELDMSEVEVVDDY